MHHHPDQRHAVRSMLETILRSDDNSPTCQGIRTPDEALSTPLLNALPEVPESSTLRSPLVIRHDSDQKESISRRRNTRRALSPIRYHRRRCRLLYRKHESVPKSVDLQTMCDLLQHIETSRRRSIENFQHAPRITSPSLNPQRLTEVREGGWDRTRMLLPHPYQRSTPHRHRCRQEKQRMHVLRSQTKTETTAPQGSYRLISSIRSTVAASKFWKN